MDPVNGWSPCHLYGLPRTRGDGPCLSCFSLPLMMAPPHTRGWTFGMSRMACATLGSPAHAGMDPLPRRVCPPLRRLPRTRGDGPSTFARIQGGHWAPPHTRGWTLPSRGALRVQLGSPAHAGMDPWLTTVATDATRLPRTRGDGPGDKTWEPTTPRAVGLIGSLIAVSGTHQRDLAARAVPVPRLLALRDVLPDPVQTCGNTAASAL